MAKRVIICIGREYGSGGGVVGERTAQKLGIACYDKNLIQKTALEHCLPAEAIAGADEKPVRWSTLGFPRGIRNPYKTDYNTMYYIINDKIYNMESDTIKSIAEKGSCVIIGRVAAEILKDDPDMISVFIHARKEDRIRRIMTLDQVDERKAARSIRETDRNRRIYHNTYSKRPWGKCSTYDISISTSRLGIDGAVKTILSLIDDPCACGESV